MAPNTSQAYDTNHSARWRAKRAVVEPDYRKLTTTSFLYRILQSSNIERFLVEEKPEGPLDPPGLVLLGYEENIYCLATDWLLLLTRIDNRPVFEKIAELVGLIALFVIQADRVDTQ
jgi:hypothetical protein